MANTLWVDGLHGYPQGEIFLLTEAEGGYDALVYNTTGLGPCPDREFAEMDVNEFREGLGCDLVWKNPRRFWLMDVLTIDLVGDAATFGGIPFNLVAKMRLPAGFDPTRDQSAMAYHPTQIYRTNSYTFLAGQQVHLLRSPAGVTWVMQTFTKVKAPELTVDGLVALGERLALPDGWRYRTVTLDRDLVITTSGTANIMADDLANMYQGLIDGVGNFDPWG